MPVLDGLEVCKFVNKQYPKCKVVIISGYKDFEYAKIAISTGVYSYLLKPVDMNEMEKVFHSLKLQLDEERQRWIYYEDAVKNHKAKEKDEDIQRNKYSLAVKNVIDYMEKHYSEKITLEAIADHIFLSAGYLSSQFGKEVGKGVTEYLAGIRVEKSKILLKQLNLKTYEVAEMVGYHNTKYFTDVFKKYTGMTPMQFRES